MTTNPFEGLLLDFLLEAEERIASVEAVLLSLPGTSSPEDARPLLDEARRELHTLKGNSGMMGLRAIQSLCHQIEEEVEAINPNNPLGDKVLSGLDALRSALRSASLQGDSLDGSDKLSPDAPSCPEGLPDKLRGSVRVPFASLDAMVDLLAEMVIFKNRLNDAVGKGCRGQDQERAWEEVVGAQEALGKTLGLIQDHIMHLRMVPLQSLFGHLRRIVHDEGARLGKDVHLEVTGGDTPLDKALLEVASEALGHMVRNAVVHGIEDREARALTGKPLAGFIRLSAVAHSNEVWVDVEDDGGGMDREALAAAAVARGIPVPTGDEIFQLLFLPGFSTHEGADMGAGRGMGLAAAAEAVRRLGGRLEVTTGKGLGSHFRVRLPLSVSIARALMLRADGEDYALPLSSIVESLHFRPRDGHLLNHAAILSWREEVIPLLDLGHTFGTAEQMRSGGYAVIIEADGKRRGLLGDELTGIRDIVVKGLDEMVGTPPGVAGSTILGDGRVVLILDPRGLMDINPNIERPA